MQGWARLNFGDQLKDCSGGPAEKCWWLGTGRSRWLGHCVRPILTAACVNGVSIDVCDGLSSHTPHSWAA